MFIITFYTFQIFRTNLNCVTLSNIASLLKISCEISLKCHWHFSERFHWNFHWNITEISQKCQWHSLKFQWYFTEISVIYHWYISEMSMKSFTAIAVIFHWYFSDISQKFQWYFTEISVTFHWNFTVIFHLNFRDTARSKSLIIWMLGIMNSCKWELRWIKA